MDRGDAALDGIATFSALMASLFGALYPSEGCENALFFSFLLTLFTTPVHAFLHCRCGADLRYVIACDICLMLQGPVMLLFENPFGPWILLIFLIAPAMAIPISKLRKTRPLSLSAKPSPSLVPPRRPRRERGSRRRKHGRRRRRKKTRRGGRSLKRL